MSPFIYNQRLDFEAAVSARRQQNLRDLQRESTFKRPELREKVLSFAQKWGLEPETVWSKVQDDWLFALQFVKDPIRQTLHQRLAAEFIKSNLQPLVADFAELPSGGAAAKWLISGMVMPQADYKRGGADKQARTVDFEWRLPIETADGRSLRFYASHKFTKDEGGTQNNQYEDLKKFVDCARGCRSPDFYYFAIADGPYYQRSDFNLDAVRMDALNEGHTERSRWQACTINQLGAIIAREARNWIATNNVLPNPTLAAALSVAPPEIPEP